MYQLHFGAKSREGKQYNFKMKMTVFCDVAPCSLEDIDRLFRRANCLHHQSDDGGGSKLL
jgi:hypothetical protein